MLHADGIIPQMFDFWANLDVHLLIPKTTVLQQPSLPSIAENQSDSTMILIWQICGVIFTTNPLSSLLHNFGTTNMANDEPCNASFCFCCCFSCCCWSNCCCRRSCCRSFCRRFCRSRASCFRLASCNCSALSPPPGDVMYLLSMDNVLESAVSASAGSRRKKQY